MPAPPRLQPELCRPAAWALSRSAAPFCIPKRLTFPPARHFLSLCTPIRVIFCFYLLLLLLFAVAVLMGVGWYPVVVWTCTSLSEWCAFWPPVCLLEKCLIKCFACFWIGFFLLSCRSSLLSLLFTFKRLLECDLGVPKLCNHRLLHYQYHFWNPRLKMPRDLKNINIKFFFFQRQSKKQLLLSSKIFFSNFIFIFRFLKGSCLCVFLKF